MIGAAVFYRRRRRNEENANLLRRRHLRILRDASNPFELNTRTFIGKYRLSQDLALYLSNQIRGDLSGGSIRLAIAPELKVLAALHFFAHGSGQKSIVGEHNIAMSQPSLCRCIKEVSEAMNKPAMLKNWIKFPNSEEIRCLLVRHYELFSLPGVLGFVDGTHVNIKKPTTHEEIYVNRKSQHSLNVQIACDSDLKIMNILARYPGSSHDSFIWSNSALRSKMQNINENGECWLLGDSGYPSEPWLLTPILHAADGSQEARYTARHIKARNCIERCIGVLKGRFRCILEHRTLEYDPIKAGKIMNACAVLHNMCVTAHLPASVDNVQVSETDEPSDSLTDPSDLTDEPSVSLTDPSDFTDPGELARAIEVRNSVIRRMANTEII